MEDHLFLVQSNVANVEGVYEFTFVSSCSAIISNSSDYIGSQIGILVEFSFPCIFK